MVLGSTITLLLAYLYARRLIGLIPALCGFLLIAFDPFHLALTRLLHLDGLLSNFMLLSLLAFISYLRDRRFLNLVISGTAAGLAWLTKSPGALLVPVIITISLVNLWRIRSSPIRPPIKKHLWNNIWPVITWGGVGILVFVVLWPAMWVNPLQSITSILNMATGYAESGHGAGVFFYGTVSDQFNNPLFYPATFLWRTTPIVIPGLVAAAWGLITKRKPFNDSGTKMTLLGLLLVILFFTISISLGAKKIDRYLLPVFVPLDLIAGMGWASLIFWINERELPILKRYWGYLILTLVIGIQMALSLRTYPYYFPYYNPLMGGSQRAPYAMKVGWGEGLEQAAQYLNQKPKAKGLRVFSWYADGPFSYFFIGRSRRMWLDNKDDETRWQRFLNSDYAVTYINQWQRNLPEQALDYLSDLEPEHTIWINGIEYIRIYKLQ
jgi:4-amino-4-deoxy-L-arabinose transferase-like glycosyltransferase